jgi:hypothetical protein
LRAAARDLIQEWKEFSEKTKEILNPVIRALRDRILEHKSEEVHWHNKKSDSTSRGTIVDCDEEVAVLKSGDHTFTYPLADLDTTKKHLNGRMQFTLVFKDR